MSADKPQPSVMNRASARHFFADLFQHAVQAVHPSRCLPPFLRQIQPARGRTFVIGAGKASAAMALALEQNWPHPIAGGLVVTRYGQGAPCRTIEIIEAAHPVPDAASEQAAHRILQLVQGLQADDQVICLISGGGSALLALPAPGLTLSDKQQLCRSLLNSGAAIAEINCVRKHLSGIKGGRLALACGAAEVHSFFISDIPGDDPSWIASGPTLPDSSTLAQALAILQRYQIPVPPSVLAYLQSPQHETPKPDDPRFTRHRQHTIASAQHALQAAAEFARQAGIETHILSDRIQGEARDIGLMHAAIALQIAQHQQPFTRPCLLLSGGETSVTMRNTGPGGSGNDHGHGHGGHGGRNSEFLLSLAIALQGAPDIHAMACDTDGIDGTKNNAGASLHPDSLQRATDLGLNPAALLEQNDSYHFFYPLDDLILSGPTDTNVNDLRAILIC